MVYILFIYIEHEMKTHEIVWYMIHFCYFTCNASLEAIYMNKTTRNTVSWLIREHVQQCVPCYSCSKYIVHIVWDIWYSCFVYKWIKFRSLCVCVCVYIFIEREREREVCRENQCKSSQLLQHIKWFPENQWTGWGSFWK